MEKFIRTKFTNEVLNSGDIQRIRKELCGRKLGSGCHRDVYELRGQPHFVVKIERNIKHRRFANVCEYRNYMDNREWEFLAQYLAPVEMISEDGRVLIMHRVQQHDSASLFPKKIPAVFTDCKRENFGWIGEQFVCCDYAMLIIVTNGSLLKRAKWWSLKKATL